LNKFFKNSFKYYKEVTLVCSWKHFLKIGITLELLGKKKRLKRKGKIRVLRSRGKEVLRSF